MVKLMALALALVGGAWFSGVFEHRYERIVDKPPSEVRTTLDRLDIGAQPGAPGSDPSRSGGIASLITHEASAGGVTWTVHSGDKVATQMIADLVPVDEGRKTRVTAHVVRGDAPDDFVAPAFRSTGVTLGLFTMALEDRLNALMLPKGDPARCSQLIEDLASQGPSADARHQDSLGDAMGDTAKAMMRLSAMEAELRRNGCPTDGNTGEFRPVREEMTR
ncbi:MAG: hypothetical protein EOO77_32730 [Oxalobacteraceae bacterium]|nr:MAG: hypothetical protein EOO77_32730 [Oxalobacteraceae bacterium]